MNTTTKPGVQIGNARRANHRAIAYRRTARATACPAHRAQLFADADTAVAVRVVSMRVARNGGAA